MAPESDARQILHVSRSGIGSQFKICQEVTMRVLFAQPNARYWRHRFMTALLFGAICAGSAKAQEAYLYFGHGLTGHDVNSALNPDLPIDVLVNGNSCLVKGAVAESFSGPFTVPPGSYAVTMSLASTTSPCANPPVIADTMVVGANQSAALIAGIGLNNQLTGYVVPLDLSPVPAGQARIIFANGSTVPAVGLQLTGESGTQYTVPTTAPGTTRSIIAPAGLASAQAMNGSNALLGPGYILLPARGALLAITVGSTVTGSFNVVGRYFVNLY
jgi:hypothetical protein